MVMASLGVSSGVKYHVAKLDSEIGDFQKLLFTRTLKLKKLGIPCKHRKLILKHAYKYRLKASPLFSSSNLKMRLRKKSFKKRPS
ncbi:unnamed protein product [Vicia faba]|uniref:Small ribosomal subunit protein mS41 SAM domain-containing protein n=1 Tax=Vicia faba TaxID=3906 RepID=A0AAV1B561_VICFA|nr:unnamed protein product [Vicia faba]